MRDRPSSVNPPEFQSPDHSANSRSVIGSLKRFALGAIAGLGAGLVAGLFAAISVLSDRNTLDPSLWLGITLRFSALSALGMGAASDLWHQLKTWFQQRAETRPELLWDHEVDGPQPGRTGRPTAASTAAH